MTSCLTLKSYKIYFSSKSTVFVFNLQVYENQRDSISNTLEIKISNKMEKIVHLYMSFLIPMTSSDYFLPGISFYRNILQMFKC